jgi:predicted transcriptional regulator
MLYLYSNVNYISVMYEKNFGSLIKQRRNELQLQQTDVAELTGLTARTIITMESGNADGKLSNWLKVLDVLGLSINITLKPLAHAPGTGIL